MDIKIEIELKDSTWGFSDLLDGRELNNQTKKEIIELLKEDIGEVFDQQIEVKQLNLSSVSQQREPLLAYEIYNASEDDKKNNMTYLENLVDTYLANNCG